MREDPTDTLISWVIFGLDQRLAVQEVRGVERVLTYKSYPGRARRPELGARLLNLGPNNIKPRFQSKIRKFAL